MIIKSLILSSIILLSKTGFAFTFNNTVGLAFKNDEVKINVVDNDCSANGFPWTTNEIMDASVEAANKFWNVVPTSRLKIRRGSILPQNNNIRDNEVCVGGDCSNITSDFVTTDILISCSEEATLSNFNNGNTSVLAVTVPTSYSEKELKGSVILLNSIPGNVLSSKTYSELVSTLAHEMGHAFGLGHSPVTDSLMYYLSFDTRSHLGFDDVDGISYLYPRAQPVSCGSIEVINDNDKNGNIRASAIALILISLTLSFMLSKRRKFWN